MPTPLEVYNFTFSELSSPEVAQLPVVERFKLRAKLFWTYYLYLKGLNDSALSPELRAARANLLKVGNILHAAISKLAGAYDAISGWFTKVFGHAPASSPQSTLGVVPLIPVAVIGVSLAAITKWSADAYTFAKKATLAEQLSSRGASPAEIAKALDSIGDGGSFFPDIIKKPLYLGGALLAVYAAYKLYTFLRKR